MGGIGSGQHKNQGKYTMLRKVEFIVMSGPEDPTFLKNFKCPNCHMRGVHYSNGEPKEHTCTNCWKVCYN